MKIEAGKYYRMRRGDVVGPIQHNVHAKDFPWVCLGFVWRKDGSYCEHDFHVNDIVAEVYVRDTPPADVVNPFQNCTIGTYAPELKTLRDEFAIAIVMALLSRPLSDNDLTPERCKIVWDNATAMMEARKK